MCKNSKALEVVVPQDKCCPCDDILLIHFTSLSSSNATSQTEGDIHSLQVVGSKSKTLKKCSWNSTIESLSETKPFSNIAFFS